MQKGSSLPPIGIIDIQTVYYSEQTEMSKIKPQTYKLSWIQYIITSVSLARMPKKLAIESSSS